VLGSRRTTRTRSFTNDCPREFEPDLEEPELDSAEVPCSSCAEVVTLARCAMSEMRSRICCMRRSTALLPPVEEVLAPADDAEEDEEDAEEDAADERGEVLPGRVWFTGGEEPELWEDDAGAPVCGDEGDTTTTEDDDDEDVCAVAGEEDCSAFGSRSTTFAAAPSPKHDSRLPRNAIRKQEQCVRVWKVG
jgi:hypothetical protein